MILIGYILNKVSQLYLRLQVWVEERRLNHTVKKKTGKTWKKLTDEEMMQIMKDDFTDEYSLFI